MKVDRNYFKKKHTGKEAAALYTECCEQSIDRHVLNKNNPADKELMEEHAEKSLTTYSSVESISIDCCKKCGRLQGYTSVLKNDKANWK